MYQPMCPVTPFGPPITTVCCLVMYCLYWSTCCQSSSTASVYQAMANGKTDAVLEDWQHVDQYKQYITKQHTVVMGGPNGVTGHIGWYIPTYLMQQYPQ